MMTDISSYLSFFMVMFLAFGIAFEIPIAVLLLVLMGILSIETLKENRRYVLIVISIVAAVLTPADAVSMCMMAAPMYLLYEAGLLIVRVFYKAP